MNIFGAIWSMGRQPDAQVSSGLPTLEIYYRPKMHCAVLVEPLSDGQSVSFARKTFLILEVHK